MNITSLKPKQLNLKASLINLNLDWNMKVGIGIIHSIIYAHS